VINCAIIPQLKYNRATQTFHQWRDGARTVYGLNFSTPDEANEFALAMEKALDLLRGSGGKSTSLYCIQYQCRAVVLYSIPVCPDLFI